MMEYNCYILAAEVGQLSHLNRSCHSSRFVMPFSARKELIRSGALASGSVVSTATANYYSLIAKVENCTTGQRRYLNTSSREKTRSILGVGVDSWQEVVHGP
jgi:hypothetical protein